MDYQHIISRLQELDPDVTHFYALTSREDKAMLKKLGLPPEIHDFYLHHNPVDTIQGEMFRLYPLNEMLAANFEYSPGIYLFDLGYRVIGGTVYGDEFCVHFLEDGRYEIVLASLETEEGISAAQAEEDTQRVAGDWAEFLELFLREDLPDSLD